MACILCICDLFSICICMCVYVCMYLCVYICMYIVFGGEQNSFSLKEYENFYSYLMLGYMHLALYVLT